MTERLTTKDTIQQWIAKINDGLDLNTVDGSFRLESVSGLSATFSGGRIRSGSNLISVPSKSFTFNASTLYTVGVEVGTGVLETFTFGTEPSTGYIPLWKVQTNNLNISDTQDFRTWAFDDSGVAEDVMQDHLNANDPHSQYATDERVTQEINALTFDSVAAMNNATWLEVDDKVRTLGYYEAGDGGGNDYEIVASATGTADGGSFIDLDNGLQAKALFAENSPINIRWFGASPEMDAATNTAAIQAAIDAGVFIKSIKIPAGDYEINGTLTVSDSTALTDVQRYFYCDGDGAEASTLIQTNNNADAFYLERGNGNTAAGGYLWGSVKNIGVRYINGLTADIGAAVRHRRCFGMLFENLLIEGANYPIISEGSAQCRYVSLFTRGTFRSEPGVSVFTFTNNGTVNRSYGNYMSNCEHQGGETYDKTFDLRAVDGLYVTNCHFNASKQKIYIRPVSGDYTYRVIQVFFNNCYFDGNGDPVRHIYLGSDGSANTEISGIYLNNCFFRVASGQFLNVDKTVGNSVGKIKNIKITGCEVRNVQQALVSFTGTNIGDNLDTVSNISIVGNIFSDGDLRVDSNPSGFGFEGKDIVFSDNIIKGKWTDSGSAPVVMNFVDNARSTGNVYRTERAEGTNETITGNATNVIQDYVAGEFTATLSSGATTTPSTVLRYIKTGNIVHVFGNLTFGTITVNGTPLEISGLPFVADGNAECPVGSLARTAFSSSDVQQWYIGDGTTTLKLQEIGPNEGNPAHVNTQASGTYTPDFGSLSIFYKSPR